MMLNAIGQITKNIASKIPKKEIHGLDTCPTPIFIAKLDASTAPINKGAITGKKSKGNIISRERVFAAIKDIRVPTVAIPKVARIAIGISSIVTMGRLKSIEFTGKITNSTINMNRNILSVLPKKIMSRSIGANISP